MFLTSWGQTLGDWWGVMGGLTKCQTFEFSLDNTPKQYKVSILLLIVFSDFQGL